MTELEALRAELNRAQESLTQERALRYRIERETNATVEQEQRRLGDQLHNTVCQSLAGILLMTRSAQRKVEAVAPEEARKIGEISEHLQRAIEELRELAGTLREGANKEK